MISYKIWSVIEKKLSNTNPYYMSDEILNWMKFEYYPVVNWKQKTLFSGKFEQWFVKWWLPSFDKWWILISITKQFLYPRISEIRLTSQKSYIYFNHTDEEGWILVDVKQAGKYIFSN